MADHSSKGKTDLLASVSRLQAQHVELICAAIDQQVGSPGSAGPIEHLGAISKSLLPPFGKPDALANKAAEVKALIGERFAITKAVQSARGDLNRAGLSEQQMETLLTHASERGIKGLTRDLQALGVYMDGVHHCIGLEINPPRRKPRANENQPLQQAVTALVSSVQLSPEAQAYAEAAAPPAQQAARQR